MWYEAEDTTLFFYLLSRLSAPLKKQTAFSFFKFLKLSWNKVDLPCCINFCCTSKWVRYTHTHTHTHIFFFMFFLIMVSYKILNIVPCAIQWILFFNPSPFSGIFFWVFHSISMSIHSLYVFIYDKK